MTKKTEGSCRIQSQVIIFCGFYFMFHLSLFTPLLYNESHHRPLRAPFLGLYITSSFPCASRKHTNSNTTCWLSFRTCSPSFFPQLLNKHVDRSSSLSRSLPPSFSLFLMNRLRRSRQPSLRSDFGGCRESRQPSLSDTGTNLRDSLKHERAQTNKTRLEDWERRWQLDTCTRSLYQ